MKRRGKGSRLLAALGIAGAFGAAVKGPDILSDDPVRTGKAAEAEQRLNPHEVPAENELDQTTNLAILEGKTPIRLTGINPEGKTWELNAYYDREHNVLTVPNMEGVPNGHIFGRVDNVPVELQPTYDPENGQLILELPAGELKGSTPGHTGLAGEPGGNSHDLGRTLPPSNIPQRGEAGYSEGGDGGTVIDLDSDPPDGLNEYHVRRPGEPEEFTEDVPGVFNPPALDRPEK